jgi:hypothetical protein
MRQRFVLVHVLSLSFFFVALWPTQAYSQLVIPKEQRLSDFNIPKVRFGVFAHNQGLIASKKEHGADLNGELVFEPVSWLFDAEPGVGFLLNNQGFTSFIYTGLSWELSIFKEAEEPGLFILPFFGMALHDGKLEPKGDRRGLGCRVVFREAIDLGWRFSEEWAVSITTDHLSHGGFCTDRNQGLDSSGVRLHWSF